MMIAGSSSESAGSDTPIRGKRRFNSRTTALQVLEGMDLTGKTALVTGCNAGIGIETARALALKNAHVVMACRNVNAAETIKNNLLAEKADAIIDVLSCDLSSLASVKAAGQTFIEKDWPLHILILNAGVAMSATRATKEGYESTFGVNHLGHFYLTTLLLPKLRESAPSRLVIVSSMSHKDSGLSKGKKPEYYLENLIPKTTDLNGMTGSYRLYAKSKLCNVLFAFALTRKENENNVYANALHPGALISTSISRDSRLGRIGMFLAKPFTKTVEQGAATTIFCAVAPEIEGLGGRYFDSCWFDEVDPLAKNEQLQDLLWEASEKMVEKFENSQN